MLPRVLLITDAQVARAGRGNSEALVRLFDRYPADKLLIAQTEGHIKPEALRLSCLGYHRWTVPWDRLLSTRLQGFAQIAKVLAFALGWRYWLGQARALAPEAIVTLCQNSGWLLAVRLARELDVPLHIIVHDGPQHFELTKPLIGNFMKRFFIAACHQASSRWSICAELDAHLTELTGVSGQIMLTIRAANDETWLPAQETSERNDAIYFGGLNSPSVLNLLQELGKAMYGFGGRLKVFGAVSPSIQSLPVWKMRSFEFQGSFADRDTFLADCRRQAALLFLPFHFGDSDMEFSFPSKLIDYTLAGLPILVQAPALSPIGKWCRANPAAVEFVDSPDSDTMRLALGRIVSSLEHRQSLATSALAAGARDFAQEPNWQAFQAALCASSATNGGTLHKDVPESAF